MIQSEKQNRIPHKKTRFRIFLMGLGFLAGLALVGARAFELHLTDNQRLSRLVKTQYKRKVVVAPKRGNISDTHGETLALDLKVDSIYASPHLVETSKTVAQNLGSALGISPDIVFKRVDDPKKKFVWIKRRVSKEESEKVKKLQLPGVGMLSEYKRFYPNGTMAANLIGAVGLDARALSGLELYWEDILKSEDPPLLVEQDAKGRSYSPYALVGLEHPKEIVLTLDKTVQYLAERELKDAVEQAKAQGGVAIVLEPQTGTILAMAVHPTFDPNEYQDYELKNWRNRAITDVFEPGSIFKAFTMAAALELGAIQPNQKLHCENGSMKVGKYTIHDHHGYGLLSLSEIIKYSSNICSYKLAGRVGKKPFHQFLQDLGFGAKTGIEIPGEQPGIFSSLKNLSPVQLGTMGFGQGISATPLQIAMAYGAIANGGSLMKPYLIKEIRDTKGFVLKKFEPQMIRRIMSEKTASQLTQYLETVVEKGGTGTAAHIEAFPVAGKTGTAQKVMEGQKGYAKNKYLASFVGFAPVQKPRLVVLVSIDEPQGAYYGGLVSGPVFKKIMEQSLTYLKVPPALKSTDSSPRTAFKEKISPPETQRKVSPKEEKKPPEMKDEKKSEIAVMEKAEDSFDSVADHQDNETSSVNFAVPDFQGLSVREALREAQVKQLRIQILGSGICHHQEPEAGNTLAEGTPIILECEPPI